MDADKLILEFIWRGTLSTALKERNKVGGQHYPASKLLNYSGQDGYCSQKKRQTDQVTQSTGLGEKAIQWRKDKWFWNNWIST